MKLLKTNSGNWVFWCSGCKKYHEIDSRWKFDGNEQLPTFKPSIHIVERNREGNEQKTICHCFIIKGQISYLKDCAHALANETVELEDA